MLSAIFRISSRGIFPMIVCDMPSFSHTSTYPVRPPLLLVPSVASAVPILKNQLKTSIRSIYNQQELTQNLKRFQNFYLITLAIYQKNTEILR